MNLQRTAVTAWCHADDTAEDAGQMMLIAFIEQGNLISKNAGKLGYNFNKAFGCQGTAANAVIVQAKASGLYMIGSMAKQQAEQEGYADALLLDWRGYVAEATGANVFLVIDGDLHTPSCEGFLNGLTRQSVISLARQGQMKVIERHIEPRELGVATEVFLAGTAAERSAPLARAARKRGEKLASTARVRGAELAESALQHGGQFADKAVARGSDMADSARERVGQRVNGRRKHRW